MINPIVRIGKICWKALFTSEPYKITPFEKLYTTETGIQLDRPESGTGLLIHEPGGLIVYDKEPVSLNANLNIRYLKGKPRYLLSGTFKEPDRQVYCIDGGCITGQAGFVYDPEKRSFIDQSAKEWHTNIHNSPYVHAIKLPPKKHFKGTTCSFLTIGADGGFYHFLFESILKAAILAPLLNQADHLLFNGPAVTWKINWLKKAGIDLSKVIWMDNFSHYSCERLIFTNRLIADQQFSNWSLNALTRLFNVKDVTSKKPAAKNIFLISRKGLNARDIKWEKEILTRHPEIKTIDLALMSPDETISTMQSATHLLAPHGAGLSNIFFCRPGTKILEIYPEDLTFQPCYQRIATLRNLDYSLMYLDFQNKEHPDLGLNVFTNLFLNFAC